MKKLLLLFGVLFITSCSVNTSDNVNVDTTKFSYYKDSRTNLCFAVVASRKSGSTDATGLGVACVPCDSVKRLLK